MSLRKISGCYWVSFEVREIILGRSGVPVAILSRYLYYATRVEAVFVVTVPELEALPNQQGYSELNVLG